MGMAHRILLIAVGSLAAVSQGCMTAWWAGNGPALAFLEANTGNIAYSACGTDRIQLSRESLNLFETSPPPGKGTSIAATGWVDTTYILWASIFYQTNSSDIFNSIYRCNTSSHQYELESTKNITEDIAKDLDSYTGINPKTGLAVALDETTGAFRLYLHAANMSILELSYSISSFHDGPSGSSELGGNPTGFALAATYNNASDSISIVAPAVGSEARVQIRKRGLANDDDDWNMVPTNLDPHPRDRHQDARDAVSDPSWPDQPTNLGLAVNSNGSNTVFYMGTDRSLHLIQFGASQVMTTMSDAPPASAWPTADQSNAPFAMASSQDGEIFLYYQAGGLVQEIHFADGAWLEATPVEAGPAAVTATASGLWACQTATAIFVAADNTTSTLPSAAPPASTINSSSSSSSSTATTTAAAADIDSECGTACGEKAKPWAIALSVLLVFFAVAVVAIACVHRRRMRREQRAIVDERQRDAAWLPCQSPSLEGIRPYSSLGALRWEEKRRDVVESESQSQSPSPPRSKAASDKVPQADVVARDPLGLPPVEEEVRPEDIGIAL